ncbi:MAG: glycosyltransferase family 2 protein [Aggregatilineales bacterium]
MTSNPLDIVIIIVTWNVQTLIIDALQSLSDDLSTTDLSYEIVVVDSASSDDTVQTIRENFPDVTMIASATNLGFAGGNNAGMRYPGFDDENRSPEELPRAVYLLNPDTITKPGATKILFDALFADEKTGVVGAQLSYEDSSFQHGAFMFPGLQQLWVEFFPTPGRFIESEFNGRYPRSLYDAGQPFEVDFTLGATMMLKREVILQTGMFDEGFFMYAEEVDWAWRIQKAGWKIYSVPQAHVVHLSGQSTKQAKPRSLRNLWESRLRLYTKHYPAWKLSIAKLLVRRGMARKISQFQQDSSLNNEDRNALIDACKQIIKLAG